MRPDARVLENMGLAAVCEKHKASLSRDFFHLLLLLENSYWRARQNSCDYSHDPLVWFCAGILVLVPAYHPLHELRLSFPVIDLLISPE